MSLVYMVLSAALSKGAVLHETSAELAESMFASTCIRSASSLIITKRMVDAGRIREAFDWWARVTKADICFRRLRLAAAMRCWDQYVAARRHWAERLRDASSSLTFSALARAFAAWRVLAQVIPDCSICCLSIVNAA